ncbi:carboxypeptidase-like regulatory domain-containing protein [uncultured Planktosalinus sp.]|uniref:carboxypeptidase-like regulatory domain-containing protein n=1 Tax=uncultured Planktosalinus sp. TaxID=1810935 RepID=UPI0030DD81D7
MKVYFTFFILAISNLMYGQTIRFFDEETNEPVSFATISFGNGLGSYANADGEFLYQKKRYPDVDTLFVSALGYDEIIIITETIENAYALPPKIDQLKEIIISKLPDGKFKKREVEPISHNNYHNSWLQTVESEIAVLFHRIENKPTKIATLLMPINVKEEVAGKKISVRKFSTLMRVKFYENNNGLPDKEISFGNVIFTVTEKEKKEVYELDLTNKNIFIPQNGIFVSIQVLGPTDSNGKLIQTKTYNEYKTKRGIEKIAVSFRPLLPLTNKLSGKQTKVRRIFFNDKKWQAFNYDYNPNSELLRNGYDNYGMGAKLHVFEND